MKTLKFLVVASVVGFCSLSGLAAPKVQSKKDLEKEIIALKKHLNEKEQELHSLRELSSGVSANAVRAPFGRFLLVKNGSGCLALRITEHSNFCVVNNTQQYTANYEWYLQTDGSLNFSKKNVQKGSGKVSEYVNGHYSAGYIKVRSFPSLEWSLGDWIYFALGATPVEGHAVGSVEAIREQSLRMASTEWVRIGDVDAQSKSVRWLSKQDR